MSVHLNGDDILDAIFNKVQLVDVKFNGGPQPSPHTPSIAARKSLSQENHSDLTKAVESSADDCGVQEVSKTVAQTSLQAQQQTNRLAEELTEAQEICNDTGLELSLTRQNSTNIGLDRQTNSLNLEEQEPCEQAESDKDTDHQLFDGREKQRGQKTEIQKNSTATLSIHTEKEGKKRPPKGLQPLKLNRDGDEKELGFDSPLSPSIYQTLNTPTEKYREIEVRTPLHESLSKAYSSFEPDRQELIRQEMGQTTSVQHLLHRFQHPKQQSTENGPELISLTMNSCSKIQFQLPPINTQKVNGRRQKIVKTPHPVALGRRNCHPLQIFPEPEVVLEEQKSVSELLSKFGVGQRVKTRKVVAATKMNGPPKVVLKKVEKASKPTSAYDSRHSEGMKEAFEAKVNGDGHPAAPAYYTYWGGHRAVAKSNRLSEPPLGSLAAIQKSLSSVPNSSASSPLPLCRSPEPQAEVFKHFFGHHSPKSVRDFYRVWGTSPSIRDI